MLTLSSQFRIAARELARSPTFTGLAVLTLALGIGSVTTTVAMLDQVVLRPLPYPEADRLVSLRSVVQRQGTGEEWGLSQAGYGYFTEHASTLEAVGLIDNLWVDVEVTLAGPDGAVRVPADSITGTLLSVLGARPFLGRLFASDDDRAGAPLTVLLSHELWTTQFGADSSIVGRQIQVEGAPREVIGVLEPGFRYPLEAAGVWVPLRLDPGRPPANEHDLAGLARLAPGATVDDAQAELDRLTARFSEEFPGAYDAEFMEEWGFTTRVEPLHDVVIGSFDRVLWTLVAGVALVLLIALANAANLFLLRAEVRRDELAVRVAHGASRGRLARDAWIDALVVCGAAVVVAILLSSLALTLPGRIAAGAIPRFDEIEFGWRMAGLAAALGLIASAVVGPLPPLLARIDLTMLREGGQSHTASAGRQTVRRFLVGGQVAVALMLLVAAGLMIRSLDRLTGQDPGFERTQLLAFQVPLPAMRYGDTDASARFYRDLMQRLVALPEVSAAGGATALPFRRPDGCFATYSDESPVPPGEPPACVTVMAATPGYLEALGASMERGRPATWREVEAGTADVVVTRSTADRIWPGQEAVGRSIRGYGWGDAPRYRVAGVVADIRSDGLDAEPLRAVFLPIRPLAGMNLDWGPFWGAERELHVVLRTSAESPESLVPAIRAILNEMDPGVAPGVFETMSSLIARSESVARTSLLMLLLGLAGALALFLCAVGLYGVVSYFVQERTREIGLRIALGGRTHVVVGSVLRQVVGIAAVGVAVGLVGSVLGTRLLGALLFEIQPNDPLTLAAAVLVLLGVTGVAAWRPATRATRIDPAIALRE